VDISASPLAGEFDVVTANLTGALLIRIFSLLSGLVRGSGVIVASGLTRDEEEGVTAAASQAGLLVRRRANEGEWIGLELGHRQS
jgi:ribosomal protein L11 methylase PrmA